MSDTTPHDGTPKPEADAAPARPEPALTYPSADAPAHDAAAHDAPAHDAGATGADRPGADRPGADRPSADRPSAANEASKRHDAALAAATERANSGSLTGEYTETERTESERTEAERAERAAATSAAAASVAPAAASSTLPASTSPANTPPSDYAPTTPATTATPPVQTPIYVQAPTPPKDRSNRGGGVLIALVATLVYGAVYAAAVFTIVGLSSSTINETTRVFTEFVVRPVFYGPVIFFFLAFALLVSLVNRAGWWSYVLFGFLVAVVVYGSYIGSALLTVQAWNLNPSEVASVVSQQWFAPFAIAAGVIAREVPIWFGAWISRRGRGVTARNAAARTEYERVLAEGPQAARSN